MKYLPEILKILEGAIKSNTKMAVNHAIVLADKLEQDGEKQCSKLVREKLSRAPKQLFSVTGGVNALPVDSESRFSLVDETKPTADQVNAILDEQTNKYVKEFVSYIGHADKLISAGVGITPSLLLSGPPGCGKTVLANHISASLGLPLLTTRCDTLMSSFLGATSKNIRALFEHATSRPCVLFLDEFDAIAKARDDKQELGELKRVVVGLLQNIDASAKNTILIAATNHPQLLDPAVWRRFAYKIEMHEPGETQRLEMLKLYLGKYAPEKSLETIVGLSEGLTGADLEQIASDAVREKVISGEEGKVTVANLVRRIIRVKNPALSSDVEAEVKMLRDCAPSVFDYRTLHNLFGLSMRRITQILKEQRERGHDRSEKQPNT